MKKILLLITLFAGIGFIARAQTATTAAKGTNQVATPNTTVQTAKPVKRIATADSTKGQQSMTAPTKPTGAGARPATNTQWQGGKAQGPATRTNVTTATKTTTKTSTTTNRTAQKAKLSKKNTLTPAVETAGKK